MGSEKIAHEFFKVVLVVPVMYYKEARHDQSLVILAT